MKSLVCDQFASIDALEFKDLPDPVPGEGEVVVDVAYSSINFPDTLIVQGLYQLKPELPFTPGHECSGIVSAIGPGVTNCKVGDRVYVSSTIGSFSEKLKITSNRCRVLPPDVSLRDASVLAVAYITSYHALKNKANLQPGKTVLVLGASGGTGTAAIEIAKTIGARVIAAASTQEKLDFCKRMGADEVINYDTEDLKARVWELTNKQGVDVVYDPVGDRYAEPAMRSLGYGGKYLVVGFAAGAIPHIPLNLALLSERSIIGVYVGAWAPRAGKEMFMAAQALNSWTKMGKIKPGASITKTFKFDEVKEALKFATTRNLIGKVLIEINPNLG
jgi:NADPH2:quinone reductase